MPQFEFAAWPGQIVWALVIFAGLFLVMRHRFLPRLRGTMEARTARIEGDMAEARRLRDEAEAQAETSRAEMAEGARAAPSAQPARRRRARRRSRLHATRSWRPSSPHAWRQRRIASGTRASGR